MINKIIIVTSIVLLSACGATKAPPYQKDRAVEDRDQYSGAKGLTQQQKDQNYLMNKELADKCTQAKIDLAVAESKNDVNEANNQKVLIEQTCL